MRFLEIAQIIVGIFLIFLIVVQTKGTGLGSAFGVDSGFYSTKRGAEKLVFITTIVTAVVFLLIPLVEVVV